MNDGNITATILNLGETTLSSLGQIPFIIITYLFFIPMSFLVPSSSGLAVLSMPVYAPLADFANVGREMVVTTLISFRSSKPSYTYKCCCNGCFDYFKGTLRKVAKVHLEVPSNCFDLLINLYSEWSVHLSK